MIPPATQGSRASARRLAAEAYELLLTSLPSSAVMLFDHDLRFVLADGPELARNGHTPELLEGRLLYDAVPQEFAALVEPNLRAALRGERFRAELPFGPLVYAYTYEPLFGPDGAVRYALVFAQDITPLREAERQALQNEARMREVVGNLPAVVFAIGADRRFRFSDGLALSRLGLRPGEIVGQLVDEAYAGHADLLSKVDLALAGQRVVADVELGGRVWETRYAPLVAEDGTVSEVIGVASDVTDRRRAEVRDRQSQRLEAVGRLAGGVAHDFNNMLTAIMSASQELSQSLEDKPELAELADMVISAADRAAQLTRQLLAFARSRPASTGPVVVDEVVQEAIALLSRSVDRRVRTHSILGAHGAVAIVDAAQLQSAVINLGINARDAMPEGGDLTIATDVVDVGTPMESGGAELPPGQYVRITVTDSGVGIAPEDLGRVFDPFFTTKEVGQGTGLGLAVVYGAARAHGGTVTVESEFGRGTTFRLLLPTSGEAHRAARQESGRHSPGKGLVLLVDDEPLLRRAGTRIISSLGYDVVTAGDGHEALRVFGEKHDALAMVLCDVVMPGMSGLEAVRAMGELDPTVPIAMCSGYSGDDHLGAAGASGRVEVLQKPYRREDLAALLLRVARAVED